MLFWMPDMHPGMQMMRAMYPMMLFTGSMIVLVIGALLYYMLKLPKPNPSLQYTAYQSEGSIGLIERFLKPDELKVIRALRQAGGTLLQKEVGWSTGLSRLKTHRVISRLAERGLVSVERVGRTNRVGLPAWLLERSSEPQQSTE
jgi:uncharacterized membrane protein